MRFKLLRGGHEQKEVIDGVPQTVRYHCNDSKRNIVKSDIDLEARFGSEKFQNINRLTNSEDEALRRQVEDQAQEIKRLMAKLSEKGVATEPEEVVVPDDDALELKAMTVSELKKLANDYQVELEPGLRKEEIINVLSQALDTA